MAINRVKGTYDILPNEARIWEKLESILRYTCSLYNFEEIRTPIFEHSELFHREHDTSDMITKETYDFIDRAGRGMTLRPEGTAGVVRSYIENKLYADQTITKLFYLGPIFRYEKPQKGRQRQFHQFGVEALGSTSYLLDAEVIALGSTIIKTLGLKGVKVCINSIGDEESRKNYREALLSYFDQYKHELCDDCQKRFEKNPLRILDCKVDSSKEYFKQAPRISDYLNNVSKEHFNNLLKTLEAMKITYEIDESLVRGLDYYTHTVFEIKADIEGFGAQNVLCGGGRYDNLVSDLGGPATSSVGFGFGMERLLLAIDAENKRLVGEKTIDLFIIGLGTDARIKIQSLLNLLRLSGIKCDTDYQDKGIKGQFKLSDRFHARFTAILGDNELNENTINVKDNLLDTQVTISIDDLYRYIIHTMQNNQSCSGQCSDCK